MPDGQTPGNGATSPYGNGRGATSAAGASSGANDFTQNPAGTGSKTGGRDFAAEAPPKQRSGTNDANPDSIPAGGRLPFSAVPASRAALIGTTAGTGGRKPFKLQGSDPVEAPSSIDTGTETPASAKVDNSLDGTFIGGTPLAMPTVSLQGSLAVGSTSCACDGDPGATVVLGLGANSCPKPCNVYTVSNRDISSPSAFVAVGSIGDNLDVEEANFLYVKTSTPMQIRITQKDTPSDVVSTLWVSGLFVLEMTDVNAVVLVEAKGQGHINIIATGNR